MSSYERNVLDSVEKVLNFSIVEDEKLREKGGFEYSVEGINRIKEEESVIKDFVEKLSHGDVNVFAIIKDIDEAYDNVVENVNSSIEYGEDFKEYVSNYISKEQCPGHSIRETIEDLKNYNKDVVDCLKVFKDNIEGFEGYLDSLDERNGFGVENKKKKKLKP